TFFENFKRLVTNIYNNQLGNIITPMWAAVALKTGECRNLFWSNSRSNHGQYGTFFRADKHIHAGLTQTIAFEHVLSLFDTIDVLKIDIEGGEYEIFSPRDSLKDALKRVRFMELETHTPAPEFFRDDEFARFGYPHQDTANEILKSFLKDCGFDFSFRGETEGGMQGYNRNFKGWKIFNAASNG
ncbi:FkbM family methyltransferase, partial [bacterium]|nr:FkbM family methyltransferase [bacterium]